MWPFRPLQSGFCSEQSGSAALARLTDSFLSAINRSDLSGGVFLDLKKAVDLVDYEIVLSKLNVYLNSSNSLLLLLLLPCSYLESRVQRVFMRGSYSSVGTVKYGVPQGSVLGSVFFSIYNNGLPLYIPSDSTATTLQATRNRVLQVHNNMTALP